MSGRSRSVYTPDRGDLVWTNFSPHVGHEMAGRHPGFVLSVRDFSVATGLVVLCPITSQVKGSPFEVVLPAHLKTKGCVVASELRTQDYLTRQVQYAGERAPQAFVQKVQEIACAVLGC